MTWATAADLTLDDLIREDFIIALVSDEMRKYKNVSIVHTVIPHIPNEVKLSLDQKWPFIAKKYFRVIHEDNMVRLVSNHYGYDTDIPVTILKCDIRDPNFNIPEFAKAIDKLLRKPDWLRIMNFIFVMIIVSIVGYLHFRH